MRSSVLIEVSMPFLFLFQSYYFLSVRFVTNLLPVMLDYW